VASTEEASTVLSERDLSAAIGSTVQGPDGEKIGTVESFFVDDRTGAPTWVAVSTGLFGTKHSIVPATQASFDDGVLNVPVHKDTVRHAPVTGGDHLGPEEETALRQHYGLTGGTSQSGAPAADVPGGHATSADTAMADTAMADTAVADTGTRPVPVPAAGMRTTTEQAAPPPASGHTGQHAVPDGMTDGAMTRSEEQLRVGTEQVAATRVRLVKYVVTEEVQVTVPIRREEIRVEHVPLDAPDLPGESLADASGQYRTGTEQAGTEQAGTVQAGSAQGGGTGAGGLPTEIVLHAERPVVGVEVVPVERVRLTTEVVQGQERITEQLRREQIVVDQTTSPQAR
jgi:stress response protein YsnF